MLNTPTIADRIFCYYINVTSHIQVARISNIPGWYFERVVFPGQRLLFDSPPEAQLEIYTGMIATAVLADRIQCQHLQVECCDRMTTEFPQLVAAA